jgi:hypothetical protein
MVKKTDMKVKSDISFSFGPSELLVGTLYIEREKQDNRRNEVVG